jgi:hypothetical protein
MTTANLWESLCCTLKARPLRIERNSSPSNDNEKYQSARFGRVEFRKPISPPELCIAHDTYKVRDIPRRDIMEFRNFWQARVVRDRLPGVPGLGKYT